MKSMENSMENPTLGESKYSRIFHCIFHRFWESMEHATTENPWKMPWKNINNAIWANLGCFFPESVWAQGSSNSGGLWYIFTSSHLHIFSSSHLLMFTYIFPSSHLHILTLLLSCPLAPSCFSISLLKARRHEMQPFRTKWGSIAKNWGKIAICKASGKPFRTKWGSTAKHWGKIAISRVRAQPFRTKWGSIAKNWGKIAMSWVRSLCVKVFVCKSFCLRKLLSVKASVCESFCV